jgi:hypothetical protein
MSHEYRGEYPSSGPQDDWRSSPSPLRLLLSTEAASGSASWLSDVVCEGPEEGNCFFLRFWTNIQMDEETVARRVLRCLPAFTMPRVTVYLLEVMHKLTHDGMALYSVVGGTFESQARLHALVGQQWGGDATFLDGGCSHSNSQHPTSAYPVDWLLTQCRSAEPPACCMVQLLVRLEATCTGLRLASMLTCEMFASWELVPASPHPQHICHSSTVMVTDLAAADTALSCDVQSLQRANFRFHTLCYKLLVRGLTDDQFTCLIHIVSRMQPPPWQSRRREYLCTAVASAGGDTCGHYRAWTKYGDEHITMHTFSTAEPPQLPEDILLL